MYDELIKRLRDAAKMSDALFVLLPHSDGNAVAKLNREAADAIEELSKPRWISVEEALPDQNDGRLYICLIVGGEYDQLSWYELCDFAEGRFWTQESASECYVTHWMPLPEPPEEET